VPLQASADVLGSHYFVIPGVAIHGDPYIKERKRGVGRVGTRGRGLDTRDITVLLHHLQIRQWILVSETPC
jgi:hypothetical protein